MVMFHLQTVRHLMVMVHLQTVRHLMVMFHLRTVRHLKASLHSQAAQQLMPWFHLQTLWQWMTVLLRSCWKCPALHVRVQGKLWLAAHRCRKAEYLRKAEYPHPGRTVQQRGARLQEGERAQHLRSPVRNRILKSQVPFRTYTDVFPLL